MQTLNETPDTVCGFWFGEPAEDAVVAARQASLWWSKDAHTDATIVDRYAPWIEQASQGALDDWARTPRGRLALILLTDQFPRNAFRDTPRAFACDALARRWCLEGLACRADAALRPVERVFLYLPLEHSESLADQDRCVHLFEALVQGSDDAFASPVRGFLDYAIRHREIIARFGRFPHRNRTLGRESSPEETVFLAQPGSSF